MLENQIPLTLKNYLDYGFDGATWDELGAELQGEIPLKFLTGNKLNGTDTGTTTDS